MLDDGTAETQQMQTPLPSIVSTSQALCCLYYSQLFGRNGPQRFLLHAYVGKSQTLSEGLEREHLGKIPGRGERRGDRPACQTTGTKQKMLAFTRTSLIPKHFISDSGFIVFN